MPADAAGPIAPHGPVPGAEAESAARRRGSAAELEDWLRFALACCDEADRIALASFRRDVAVDRKPDRTLVTAADRGIEERIRGRIRERFPRHGLVGEEYGEDAAGASERWYIDPIDGTHNFVRGVPLFGTLLGLERDGELQLGVMSAPALGERWWASRGGGAWAATTSRRGHAPRSEAGRGGGPGKPRRLHVSRVGRLADSHVLYSSPLDIERSGRAPGFRVLLERAWRDRAFGDFWSYALVAEGAAEAMVEVGVKPWDLAAPLVLIEEAGGRLTDLAGRRDIATGSVLASNGLLHARLLAVLRGTT
jgi:histidinol-phosphatase